MSGVFIPAQEERYRKVASVTLFLCVMLPSAVVYWLFGSDLRLDMGGGVVYEFAGGRGLLECAMAFLWPVAYPVARMGVQPGVALCLSAFVQACAFFALSRSRRMTPKARLTIAVLWGMGFALILRVLLAFELSNAVMELHRRATGG